MENNEIEKFRELLAKGEKIIKGCGWNGKEYKISYVPLDEYKGFHASEG